MTDNPDRAAIEQALSAACMRGQLHSWERYHASKGPGQNKWQVTLNPGWRAPDGRIVPADGVVVIRTYQEGRLFCAALATTLAADPGSLAGQLDEQLARLGDDYDTIRAGLDDGDSDLDLLEQVHMTISHVLTAAGRLG